MPQCHLNEKYEQYGHGVCPGGTTLGIWEQCNGQCYNQYSQEVNTSALSSSSMYRCDNGDCVPVTNICRGYPMCGDKSDLRACNPELTCVSLGGKSVSMNSNVSTINSKLVDGHSFCIYSNERNNGNYEAITREDEDNLDIVSTSTSLDYTKIEHCSNDGNPGVMCGSECLGTLSWCRAGSSNPCDDGAQVFTTNNPGLCRNSTFWRDVSCAFYGNGTIAARGLRCTGGMQHCIYPWYLSGNDYYEAGFMVMSLIA